MHLAANVWGIGLDRRTPRGALLLAAEHLDGSQP